MADELIDYEVQFGGFDRLMPYRVHEILLVSSPYDSFIIAEDNRLTELVFSEYLDLNLRYAPRITRVSTAEEALERIRSGRFDLVLTMMRVGDMDIAAFVREARRAAPGLPVVLLAYSLLDVERAMAAGPDAVDRAFLWLGDARILLAIIKLIEDRANIDRDIETAGVQALLVIEDSVRFYSSYLPRIYTELMKQTQRLIAEGVNLSHKMLRMRARPKILFAADYESAWELYTRYRSNLLGCVTDIQFPRAGVLDPEAGLDFIARVKGEDPDMPALLQSSDPGHEPRAHALRASFLNKGSPSLLQDLQRFMLDQFGFGDFVFRMPGGREVARVADLHSMVEALQTVPDESLAYHAGRNHFSRWLMARTEFAVAYRIRPRRLSEFRTLANLRAYLIDAFTRFLHETQSGVVADFTGKFFSEGSQFVKMGGGSLGGKARGLAFFNSLMGQGDFAKRFPGASITVPNTCVVATDHFDAFMEQNRLYPLVRSGADDDAIERAFLSARLPDRAMWDLAVFAERVRHPLAVRSSSLMEDSQSQPFAGIYKTFMLPNNHPDPGERLRALERAVKLVYASTFSQEARAYLASTPHLLDEEKMAVILQRLVGERRGGRFYPSLSGVAQSYDYYPVAPVRPEDGVATVALGLGMTVLEGYRALRFSPRHPQRLHQLSSVKGALANAQREFMALDLDHPGAENLRDATANIRRLGLEAAEMDGTLDPVGSTYSAENDKLYDGIDRPGTRLVTFAHVLKSGTFPLAEILRFLLDMGRKATGVPVELEFAADLDSGEFAVLQLRPMAAWSSAQDVAVDGADRLAALCLSPKALGNGRIEGVADVVYVRPESFDPAATREIAREIGSVNAALERERRGYLLIGPGRWGTADPWLGVPVGWGQISAAKAIVETSLEGFWVDPSFATHFLHNVVSLGVGYFTVNPTAGEGAIDWEWLKSRPAAYESARIRHLRLERPLDIRIDGRSGRGVVLKP